MTAKADIRNKVKNRLANIPSELTDTIIDEFVEDAHLDLENFTGASIDTSDISATYQSVLTDMTLVKVIDYMCDKLVSKGVAIGGDVSINYGEVVQSLSQMRNSLEKRIDKNLNMIGVKRTFEYTQPA